MRNIVSYHFFGHVFQCIETRKDFCEKHCFLSLFCHVFHGERLGKIFAKALFPINVLPCFSMWRNWERFL